MKQTIITIIYFLFFALSIFLLGVFATFELYEIKEVEPYKWLMIPFLFLYFLIRFLSNYKINK